MRDLFPGWVPPSEETLNRYWEEATFAVDASVLLDLYRFSSEAREGLLAALRSFGSRLWIPNQVALEFHRNRFGVLLDQREAEGKLLQELDGIQTELDDQLSQRLRGAGRRDLAPLREAIKSAFNDLRKKLQEAEKEHTAGLGESIQEDPIYDEVVDLCNGRVGPAFGSEDYVRVVEDAKKRFASKVPPGYLDAEKEEEHRYGDVIIWHQICKRAEQTKKPVVLVADDRKTDWVWEVRGKTLGPRPELVAEMQERAGVGFHLYTPGRLLQVWEDRGGGAGVEPDVLKEIEDPRSSDVITESVDQVWQSVKESAPRPIILRPVSQVLDDFVFLAMDGEIDSAFEAHLIVRGPDNASASVILNSDQPGRGRLPIFALYPEDFTPTPTLMSGAYVVSWSFFVKRGKLGMEHKTVHDRFVIPEG